MIEYERTNLNGVPDYTAVEFEGRRHDYCLLIPVINEGARILTELGRAQKAGIDQLCDIVICDGGSVLARGTWRQPQSARVDDEHRPLQCRGGFHIHPAIVRRNVKRGNAL